MGGGMRVCFIEGRPPSLPRWQICRRSCTRTRLEPVVDALSGHHDRAVAFFALLAGKGLGPDVHIYTERSSDAQPDGGGGIRAGGEGGGDVPALGCPGLDATVAADMQSSRISYMA